MPGNPKPNAARRVMATVTAMEEATRTARDREDQQKLAPIRDTIATAQTGLLRLRDRPTAPGSLPLDLAREIITDAWPAKLRLYHLRTDDAERMERLAGDVLLAFGDGRAGAGGAWCWPAFCEQRLKEIDAITTVPLADRERTIRALMSWAEAIENYVPAAERSLHDMTVLLTEVGAKLQRRIDEDGVRLDPLPTTSKDAVAEPEPDDRPKKLLITNLGADT